MFWSCQNIYVSICSNQNPNCSNVLQFELLYFLFPKNASCYQSSCVNQSRYWRGTLSISEEMEFGPNSTPKAAQEGRIAQRPYKEITNHLFHRCVTLTVPCVHRTRHLELGRHKIGSNIRQTKIRNGLALIPCKETDPTTTQHQKLAFEVRIA